MGQSDGVALCPRSRDRTSRARVRLCGRAAHQRREARLTSGLAYARQEGVAHNVINANEFEFRFLEIEMLQGRVSR